MNRFLFCLVALLPYTSFAQTFSFELWHDGKVVLESGTLSAATSSMTFRICCKSNTRIDWRVFLHAKQSTLKYLTRSTSATGIFILCPTPFPVDIRPLFFFEVLTEGKITVLSREKIEYRTYSSPFMGGILSGWY